MDQNITSLRCPHCEKLASAPPNIDLLKCFCPSCQQPLDLNRIGVLCPNCAKKNLIHNSISLKEHGFCRECGSPLDPVFAALDAAGTITRIGRKAPKTEAKIPLPSTADDSAEQLIQAHVTQYCGTTTQVYHELASDLIHLDVLHIAPGDNRNYHSLVTCGMSYLAMEAPAGKEQFAYTELLLRLPPDWPMDEAALSDEQFFWPIQCLKTLGRFPHVYRSWLGPGHTVPNGNPTLPYATNTKFNCALLLPAVRPTPEFYKLPVNSEKTILFYEVILLYKEEMNYLLWHGHIPFLAKLEAAHLPEWLDVERPNICEKKSFWPWKK